MSVKNAYHVGVVKAVGEIAIDLIKLITSYDRGVIELSSWLGTFVYDGTSYNPTLQFNGQTLISNLNAIFSPSDDKCIRALKLKDRFMQNDVYQVLYNSINPGRPNSGPETVEVDYEDLQLLLSLVKAVIPGKVPLAFTRIRNDVRTQMKNKTGALIDMNIDPLEKIREVERIEMLIRKCDDGSL